MTMRYEVFTIRDASVELFLPPFYARTIAEARRSVLTTAMNVEHDFFRHAEDYSLYMLGAYREETGAFELLAEPLFVVKVVTLLRKETV